LQYLLGSADEATTEKMRKKLSELATGWDVEKLREIAADSVSDQINPYVYQEAINLIAEHHELGHDVVIISASATELVEPIAQLLGADHFVATVLTVNEGKYTGDIEFYAYGEYKAEAIAEMARNFDYNLAESYAYTDSCTDVPMLEAVGYGTVVNPDRNLRQMAVERGWTMLRFANPITLRGSVAQKVASIPGHVASIPGHVATFPSKVAIVPEVMKDHPKKTAAIAAAGAAVAGIAIVRTIKRNN
jgi:HAD superfamily hydrolase (TIGR01490 family)